MNLLCGRQEIALRGNKDCGRLCLEQPLQNDGNFRTLLRYRAQHGDDILKKHIQSAGGNAMYNSPVVQNELINIISEVIQQNIISQINNVKYFTVLADETSDVSRIEQFSLCVRHVSLEKMELREDFLEFVGVEDLTGKGLVNTIKVKLQKLGLNLNNLRGQGYDGASAMRGIFNGVQAQIQAEYPTAIYTHCASHCFNLCLNDASNIRAIRNCIGTIKEICNFFRASARRTAIMKSKLGATTLKAEGLKKYCETRWIERHEAMITWRLRSWRLRSGKKGEKRVVEERVKVVPIVNHIRQALTLIRKFAENNILDFEK